MRARSSNPILRWVSIISILVAVILLVILLIFYSRSRANFPPGMVIAGVPVGNLSRQQAAERLLEVYSLPVELHYEEAIIQVNPGVLGFELGLDSMMAAADLQRTSSPFWVGFWDYLWGNRPSPQSVPLTATVAESQIRSYLVDEIALRYDKPSTPAQPVVGTINFQPGEPGSTIDVEEAVFVIKNALSSPTQRVVNLPLQESAPSRPSLQNLQILLQQTMDLAEYDGLAGIYLQDLQTAQELHFIYENGEYLPTEPDVAFTAASIIKIPIMVSIFQHFDGELPAEAAIWLNEMITKSGNDPADWLMENYLDPTLGPLVVTEDMRALGLESTFMAGHFRLGSPLLQRIETPGNSRPDVDTDPDDYNQTTASDIGMLLADIYQCAQTGGGALVAVFPGEITQSECQTMIALLQDNFLGALITAGLPEATPIAHKHGWISNEFGAINTIGDAAIVYTPSGNYILVIFFYHPVQLVWEPISGLIGELSRAVYNYFNLTGR